ncbi:MAG: ligand-binding sensor protein [Clostridium sp.]|jgi:ligand-binding sensor protein
MIIKLANGELDVTALEINDVLDTKLLQPFQDDFATSMTIASVTVDKSGTPITKPSSYTSFCINFTHSTKIGDDCCAASHKKGGEEAARIRKPYIYTCHAGLIDFAAPILVGDYQIGTILGGQILTAPPEESQFRKTATEIGVNENDYIDAVNNISLTTEQKVTAAADVLYLVANSLSQ